MVVSNEVGQFLLEQIKFNMKTQEVVFKIAAATGTIDNEEIKVLLEELSQKNGVLIDSFQVILATAKKGMA